MRLKGICHARYRDQNVWQTITKRATNERVENVCERKTFRRPREICHLSASLHFKKRYVIFQSSTKIHLSFLQRENGECLKFHFRETGKPSTSEDSDIVRVGVLGRGATSRLGRCGLALLHPGVRGVELAQLGTVRLGPLLILVFNL